MEIPENQIRTALAMFRLCRCALTDTTPDRTVLSGVSLKELYQIGQYHSLSALICDALERMEWTSPEEQQCLSALQKIKEKSVRKNLLLDTERASLSAFLEENHIWYMPLKGVVLKDLYPKMGLRQMADNDILFDETFRQALRDWFVGRGYEIESYGIDNHDVYLKAPVYNYEMHVSLYGDSHKPEWWEYYKAVKDRLIKDEGNYFGYHFTDEDFYLYFLSHGYKHFDSSGTGLRFLVDLLVYLRAKEDTMDFAYIEKELEVLGLTSFEASCRALVSAVFSSEKSFDFQSLPQNLQEMFLYFLSSGTYGTLEQGVQNGIEKYGKFKYFLLRIFPGPKILVSYHPIFRHKWLIPVGWVYRWISVLASRPGRVKNVLKAFSSAKR